MKKIKVLFYSVLFFSLASCSDGTSKPADTKDPVTTTPANTPPPKYIEKKETPPVVEKKVYVETKAVEKPKTEISIGQNGGSVKTKKGSDISIGQSGVKIGTRDVKIDIKRDTN